MWFVKLTRHYYSDDLKICFPETEIMENLHISIYLDKNTVKMYKFRVSFGL